jgi:hypothetical protein
MKIRTVGTEFFHADGQTDMTQLMHFSQFCERTYKQIDFCISPCTVFWIMTLSACEVYFTTVYLALRGVEDWISGDNLKRCGRGLMNVPH